MFLYNKKLKERARDLRKNMTDVEIILWSKLKSKQINNLIFYRQKPIGNYIVDFYCASCKLVIELDGSQHYTDEGIEYDRERETYLNGVGLTVIRFTNLEVKKNLSGVLNKIVELTKAT